ncbi:MAG: hypothetical protein HY671_00890 [Chloroflexi bacterium]|nr:hypothetical protein [Chloroflexota bacterium]
MAKRTVRDPAVKKLFREAKRKLRVRMVPLVAVVDGAERAVSGWFFSFNIEIIPLIQRLGHWSFCNCCHVFGLVWLGIRE